MPWIGLQREHLKSETESLRLMENQNDYDKNQLYWSQNREDTKIVNVAYMNKEVILLIT